MKKNKQKPPPRIMETGQGLTEYAIILILVGIAVVLVVTLMQPAIGDVFSRFVAQAPVAPPELLNYTPPPTFTSTATVDPNASPTPAPTETPTASNTPVPTNTVAPTNTSAPTNTLAPSNTPTPSNTPSPTPCPVPNTSHTIPATGTVRIQMEDFRCGGAGVAFSDQTNDGGPGSGSYRPDVGSEGPDLENTSDAGGGRNVGWTRDGEWIEFEINAPAANTYTFIVRNASQSASPRIQVRTTSAVSGLQTNSATFTFNSTGGWQNWQSNSINVSLFQGRNFVRFNIVTGNGNFNYFDVAQFVPTATPTPVTPTATPVPTNTVAPTNTPVPVVVTLYSNATHDGEIRENNGTGNGANNQVDSTSDRISVGDNDDNWNEQYIGIVSFNTASIPANATITRVELRLQQQGLNGDPFNDSVGLGALFADIAPNNGFSNSYNLQATDFQSLAASNNVVQLDEPTGDNDWADGLINTSFFNLINRNGFTQFKIHFEFPDNGDRSRDRFRFYSGNNPQANQPQLIITYTVP